MTQQIQDHLQGVLVSLTGDATAMAAESRRGVVATIVDAILCHDAAADPVVTDLVDVLARDPDWSVRLEVAQMVHLLGDEACSRYVALFRGDCNRYVRTHAERSLSRQRKAKQVTSRKHTNGRAYADELDQFTRQYGNRAAATLQRLVDQRYAMLAAPVAHDVRGILTTLAANTAALTEQWPDWPCAASCGWW